MSRDESGDGIESDGDMLARLGTDGAAWAAEFESVYLRLRRNGSSTGDLIDSTPGGWLHGWFCNAIEAGRSAGHGLRRAPENTVRLPEVDDL